MRYIFVVNFFILSLSSFAQDPFKVPKEEIGKMGLYSLTQVGIPLHSDYKEIFSHCKNYTIQRDSSNRYIKLKVEYPSFKIFAPETYNSTKPAGIIILAISDPLEARNDLTEALEYCRFFAEKRNFICIGVVTERIDYELLKRNNLFRKFEYSALIRRAVDVVKARYRIDEKRIVTFANGANDSLFITTACNPDIFKNNSFLGLSNHFYDKAKNPNGKNITIISNPEEQFKTLGRTARNKYLFYTPYLIQNPKAIVIQKAVKNLQKDLYIRNNFTNTQFIDFTLSSCFKDQDVKKLVQFENLLDLMIDAIDKADPLHTNSKRYFIKAQEYDLNSEIGKAYQYYKLAVSRGLKEAEKKLAPLEEKISELLEEIKKFHQDKNFPEAYKALIKVGANNDEFTKKLYNFYTSSSKIKMEIKASTLLDKALKSPKKNSVQIHKLCKSIIKSIPETVTAKRALKILNKSKHENE